jgi:hypothetical protein
VRIATNSPLVLRAAQKSWSAFPSLFPGTPIDVRVVVTECGADCPAPAAPPVYRAQGHLLTIAAGPSDFAVADLAAGFCAAQITSACAAGEDYLRHFFLDALICCALSNLRFTSIHAACVALHGRAVLLCGPSGAGKSSLAYMCARRGFTYVSDDVSYFLRGSRDRTVIGKPMQMRFRPNAADLFPELGGLLARTRANGKPTIEVSTSELEGVAIAYTAPLQALVFLARDDTPGPALVRISRQEARRRLEREIPVLERRTWEEQLHSLDMLLEAGMFELHYAEAAHAAAALEAYCRKERPHEASVLADGSGGARSGAGGLEQLAR